jgi:hypothetical protein
VCHHSAGLEATLCIENQEQTATAKFTSTSGESQLAVTELGTIVCKKDKNTGEFEVLGDSSSVTVSDLAVTFEECELKESTTCVVPNIVADGVAHDGLDGEFILPGNGNFNTEGKVSFFPSDPPETLFAVIKINNKLGKTCLVAGSYNVTGKQKCKLVEPEVEKLTHSIECLEAESELKVGAKAAKLKSTDEVTLTSEKKYSIRENLGP